MAVSEAGQRAGGSGNVGVIGVGAVATRTPCRQVTGHRLVLPPPGVATLSTYPNLARLRLSHVAASTVTDLAYCSQFCFLYSSVDLPCPCPDV